MKKIYLILMHTNTIPSKLVKFFTRYKYSHVAISLDKNCDTIYSFGRRKVNSILNGGFVIQKKQGEFFKKFDKTTCRIYELDVNEEQYKDVKNILDNMQLNPSKYKYDFIGIIPRFLGTPFTIKNRYVCSYFIADILEKAKIYKFNKKAYFVKPKDFETIQDSKQIYSGLYMTYMVNEII